LFAISLKCPIGASLASATPTAALAPAFCSLVGRARLAAGRLHGRQVGCRQFLLADFAGQ